MKETALIEFYSEKDGKEWDIEVPTDISADEFIDALNDTFALGIHGGNVNGGFSERDGTDIWLRGSHTLSWFGIRNGSRIFAGEHLLVKNAEAGIKAQGREDCAYPLFRRNTRMQYTLPKEPIALLTPAPMPVKPARNLALTIMPAFSMLALTLVMRSFMSGSSGSYIVFSVCSMSVGVVTSLASFIGASRQYKREIAFRRVQYNSYISGKRGRILTERKAEKELLEKIYRDTDTDIRMIKEFSSDLFDRLPKDMDFLSVYLGRGRRISGRQVEYKKSEAFATNDDLQRIPPQLAEQSRYIEDAPVTLDLQRAGAVGIIADKKAAYGFLKTMTTDIIARQYYGEVKLFFLLGGDAQSYAWLKYLPHALQANGLRNVAYDKETQNTLFEYLYKEFSWRSEHKDGTAGEFFIVFVVDSTGFLSHPISRFVEHAKDIQAAFVFFERDRERLPLHCNQMIALESEEEGELHDTKNVYDVVRFSYRSPADEDMHEAGRILAPVYCEEVSLDGSLRKNVTLFEVLHIASVEELGLKERWERAEVYRTLAAPIGINAKEDTVFLDLHEKAHGPHGLVAGTTGSGKSEILLTYILSAATLYPPSEISFMTIDFKGGGMANRLAGLPHLAGAITDIDGQEREIDRSLKSIRAELLKRKKSFADAGVDHIDAYIRLYREGRVKTPLPHLVIIVDEFAELKAQRPDFMKELISVARTGRSLGVHLILATQKPAGQVDEQIWSNSRFRLCLKVQTREDSNEVLRSPLAAEIKEAGRAYLQVGNNEIFELFQSGFSGAPEKKDDTEKRDFTIAEVAFSGKRTLLYTRKKESIEPEGRDQLKALVSYLYSYCKENDIKGMPPVCLPPLREYIVIPEEITPYTKSDVPVGVYDNPEAQLQGEARFDFCGENTLIIGSTATGKTNLMQTIIRQLVSAFSPEELNFYILDFGAMYLKNYELLNHVGGVAFSADEEKIRNLFRLLTEEIRRRKQKFAGCGLSSFAAYREAGYTDVPQILFLLDNFSVFKELYAESHEEEFLFILGEGLGCGISVIATNAQTAGLSYKYLSNFGNRIVFHCNDSSEYAVLLERCRMQPKDTAGRALFQREREIYEMQTYLAFEGEKEIERSTAVRRFITEINNRYAGQYARKIPEIPAVLDYAYIENMYGTEKRGYRYPIGLRYEDVDIAALDFGNMEEFCIVGKEKERRIEALCSILASVEANLFTRNVVLSVFDNIKRPLKHLSEKPYVDKYTIEYEAIGEKISELKEEMERRYQTLINAEEEGEIYFPLRLIIVNQREAMDYIAEERETWESYGTLTDKYKGLGFCFLYTDMDDVPANTSFKRHLRDKRQGIATTVSARAWKFYDVNGKLKNLEAGDAYLLNDTATERIRLLHA